MPLVWTVLLLTFEWQAHSFMSRTQDVTQVVVRYDTLRATTTKAAGVLSVSTSCLLSSQQPLPPRYITTWTQRILLSAGPPAHRTASLVSSLPWLDKVGMDTRKRLFSYTAWCWTLNINLFNIQFNKNGSLQQFSLISCQPLNYSPTILIIKDFGFRVPLWQ